MTRLANYFLQGLIFLVPIALTAWAFWKVFITIDGWLQLSIPGLGVAVMLVGVTAFGFLASNFLTGRILRFFENALERLPLAKLLHSSIKDLMSAFVGDKKRFDKPVLVDLAPGGIVRALGFVTRESLASFDLPDSVAVYFPQAYNFAGQLVIVPRTAIRPLKAESSDIMTMVVSGGVSGP